MNNFRGVLRKAALSSIFGTLGRLLRTERSPVYIQYRPDFHRLHGLPGFPKLQHAWSLGDETNNGGDAARFYAIYRNAVQVLDEGVPGDIVELGVYKGNSAAILADLGRRRGRETYLFDTFSGFDDRDFQGDDAAREPGFSDTSVASVKKLVGEDRVHYVVGFFPESCESIELPSRIAIAHIDCDLGAPMKAGLELFYPRLSVGGLLIMHDYGSTYWPALTAEIDSFFKDKPEKVIVMPDKCGTAVVRKSGRT